MTGPEHYREAEQLIAASERLVKDGKTDFAVYAVDRAKVHATLALAAATALPCGVLETDEHIDAWFGAAGEKP